jgi:hypothetical protein
MIYLEMTNNIDNTVIFAKLQKGYMESKRVTFEKNASFT